MKLVTFLFMLLFFAGLSCAPANAADVNVKLIIDGKSFKGSECAIMRNGMMFLPGKPACEKMKITFFYDDAKKRVKMMKKGGVSVILFAGKKEMNVNGVKSFAPVAPFSAKGHVYVPLSVFERYMGAASQYDGKKKILRVINNTGKSSEIDINGEKNMNIDDIDDLKDF